MPVENPPASSPEIRNARGEWRPPYPCKYAPILVWPPKPKSVLKWALS